MRTTCTRRIGIDAGHRVTRHESKCRNVHGHRYEFEITVSAPGLDDVGRVVDFGVVKELVGGWLLAHLDHGYIAAPWDDMADVVGSAGHKVFRMPGELGEPTAENLAMLVLRTAQGLLPAPLRVDSVRVWETPNSFADAVP